MALGWILLAFAIFNTYMLIISAQLNVAVFLVFLAAPRGSSQDRKVVQVTAEELQEGPGGTHDRIGIGRNQFVDAQHRCGRLREPRLLRCCRCGYPVFGRVGRGRRRIAGRLR